MATEQEIIQKLIAKKKQLLEIEEDPVKKESILGGIAESFKEPLRRVGEVTQQPGFQARNLINVLRDPSSENIEALKQASDPTLPFKTLATGETLPEDARITGGGLLERFGADFGDQPGILDAIASGVSTGQKAFLRPLEAISDISGIIQGQPSKTFEQAAGEFAGQVTDPLVPIGAGQKPRIPTIQAARRINQPAQQAIKTARRAAGVEVPLSGAEQTTGRFTDFVESFIEKSPFSSGQFEKFGLKQIAALEKGVRKAESRIGLAKDAAIVDEAFIGQQIGKAIDRAQSTFRNSAKKLYDKVEQVSTGTAFNPISTRKALQNLRNDISRAGGQKEIKGVVKDFQDILGPGLKGDVESFAGLRSKQARINGLITDATDSNVKRQLGILKSGIEKDFKMLENGFVNKGNAEAAKALATANKFFKEQKKIIDVDIINKTAKLFDPKKLADEKAFDVITKGTRKQIAHIKRVLGDQAFEPVKQRFFQNIVRDPKTGELDVVGDKLLNNLRRFGGKNKITEILGQKDTDALFALANVARFAKTAQRVSKTPASFNLSTLGAGATGGGFVAGAAGVPFATSLATGAAMNNSLGRIWFSDAARNFLVNGTKGKNITEGLAQSLILGASQIANKENNNGN